MLDAKNRYARAKEKNSVVNKTAKVVGAVTGLGTLEKMAKGENIAFEVLFLWKKVCGSRKIVYLCRTLRQDLR